MNLFLDWSGTLADDEHLTWELTNKTLEHFGGDTLDFEAYRREFQLPVSRFYNPRLPGGFTPDVDAFFFSGYREAAPIPLFPGIPESIQKLSLTHALYILSTTSNKAILKTLDRHGLRDCFREIYGETFDKEAKLPGILKEQNLLAHESIVIGDTPHDLEAGKAAGTRTGAVLYGYTEAGRMPEADYTFHKPGDILSTVEKLQLAEASPLPVVTVGGLVFNAREEALFVRTQKWSGLYGTPGGKVERGETLEEAFRREILEETGLNIENIRYVFYQDCIHHPQFYKPMHFVLMNYVATTTDTKVKLNYESTDYRWKTLEHARGLPLNQPTLALIRELERREEWTPHAR